MASLSLKPLSAEQIRRRDKMRAALEPTRGSRVIITVPHGLCPDTPERNCDLRADAAASAIVAALPAGVSHAVYRAPSYRADGDLNRPSTRDTDWRREVQADVEESVARGQRVLLLDVHSFPGVSESFGTVHGAVPQLVVLDDPAHRRSVIFEQIEMQTSVQAAARLVGTTRGLHSNDITVQARAAGAEAQLWEFNEDEAQLSGALLAEIAAVLARQ